jgi:hypothetical protein
MEAFSMYTHLFAGVILLFFAFAFNCNNLQSVILVKVIPFLVGLAAILNFVKDTGLLS